MCACRGSQEIFGTLGPHAPVRMVAFLTFPMSVSVIATNLVVLGQMVSAAIRNAENYGEVSR